MSLNIVKKILQGEPNRFTRRTQILFAVKMFSYILFSITALLSDYVSQENSYNQLITDVESLTAQAESLISDLSTGQEFICQ